MSGGINPNKLSPNSIGRGREQDLYPVASGKAQGKPQSKASKPERESLAELFARDKPGQLSRVSLQNLSQPPAGQTPTKPHRKGSTPDEKGGDVHRQSNDPTMENAPVQKSAAKKFVLGTLAAGTVATVA
jgi:hypothetical protein